MGTRSTLLIKDGENDLVNIYRQYDGYPSGMGADIKKILGDKELVNGFSNPETQVNGMGCAAAMVIGGLKQGKCGNVYITSFDDRQGYHYTLHEKDMEIYMTVEEDSDKIYDGKLSEFNPNEYD